MAEKRNRRKSGINVHLVLVGGAMKAALAAHETKEGIEAAAAQLLEEKFRKPFDGVAAEAVRLKAARKRHAADDREAATAERQAGREAEKVERKRARDAAKRKKKVEAGALAMGELSKEERKAALELLTKSSDAASEELPADPGEKG